jgi:hypothetical protein
MIRPPQLHHMGASQFPKVNSQPFIILNACTTKIAEKIRPERAKKLFLFIGKLLFSDL